MGMRDFLGEHGISFSASTYQANSVLTYSSIDVQVMKVLRPMGITTKGNRLAVGGAITVTQYHGMGDLGKAIAKPATRQHAALAYDTDLYYLPHNFSTIGGVNVHDVAFSHDEELWFCNTKFSCLCKLDFHYSFVPFWKPPFIGELTPEDKCHLNGLAVGRHNVATMFAMSDQKEGWRDNVKNQGMLVEVPTGEVVADGLSMPHSPRS